MVRFLVVSLSLSLFITLSLFSLSVADQAEYPVRLPQVPSHTYGYKEAGYRRRHVPYGRENIAQKMKKNPDMREPFGYRFAKAPRPVPPTEYTLTHHLEERLMKEREHLGEWLGVGGHLPVPITSGPVGASSNEFAPSNTIVGGSEASSEVRFMSMREGQRLSQPLSLSSSSSHEDGLSISMPREEMPHRGGLQRIKIPKRLQQLHNMASVRDPLVFDKPPQFAPPPER